MIYTLLIGYKYENTSNELLGVEIDLTLVYNYCHFRLGVPNSNIKIITDIKELSGIPCDKYLCQSENFTHILSQLSSCMNCKDLKVIFYYSGQKNIPCLI